MRIFKHSFLWLYNKNIQIDHFDLPTKEITFFLISLLFILTNFIFLSIGFFMNSDYLFYDYILTVSLASILFFFRVPYCLGLLNFISQQEKHKKEQSESSFYKDFEPISSTSQKIDNNKNQEEPKSKVLPILIINPKNRHLYMLGLKENATFDEIKTAYRRLSMKYHPDRNLNRNTTERFKIIKNSYEQLKTMCET